LGSSISYFGDWFAGTDAIEKMDNLLSTFLIHLDIFFQTFLTAKVKDIAGKLFLKGRSLWKINPAIGILDEFFWLELSIPCLFDREHISQEETKSVV
jgi:hypothetical protein